MVLAMSDPVSSHRLRISASTFVNIVRLVLTEKGVPFTKFCDLE